MAVAADMAIMSNLGSACLNPIGTQATKIQVIANAQECPARLCVVYPPSGGTAKATCSMECTSDSDCAHPTDSTECPGRIRLLGV